MGGVRFMFWRRSFGRLDQKEILCLCLCGALIRDLNGGIEHTQECLWEIQRLGLAFKFRAAEKAIDEAWEWSR